MVSDKRLIELKGISKSFGDTEVLHNIDLYILQREFITLLGPSGCGKTTLLRIIGGFEEPSAGSVCFDGVDMTAVPPHKRRVNTVFQKYALFTHLSVFDNVAFGLNLKSNEELGVTNRADRKKEIARRVDRLLRLVKMENYGNRWIEQLSGGQQQRIAIARALVCEPEVLLLDEPLGALDLKLRKEMQTELKAMQQQLGITFIYVTHDQEEALTMSDTIVVMNGGRIQQIGTPKSIYDEPKNAFVADFIGESNIFPGKMPRDREVVFEGRSFECVDTGFAADEDVDIVIRPEDVEMTEPEDGLITGTIESVVFKGVHFELMVTTGFSRWKVHSTQMRPVGTRVGLTVVPFNIHVMHRSAQLKTADSAPVKGV